MLSYDLKTKLNKDDKNILIEAYHEFYEYLYGIDYLDAFIKVTNVKLDDYKLIINKTNNSSSNLTKAFNTINKDNILYLFIYKDNILKGVSRIKENIILDIIPINSDIKALRAIYKEIVLFIENYLINKNYNKVFLKIPIKEGPLLIRSQELGYVEDVNYINNQEYVVSKDLER